MGEIRNIDGKYYDMREMDINNYRTQLETEKEFLLNRIQEIDTKLASFSLIEKQTLTVKIGA